MVKRGCFEGLDMCFTWHPIDRTTLWGRTLAYYKVRFDFKGITAHAGGAPELGRSALDACELMNVGVNYLREHIIFYGESALCISGCRRRSTEYCTGSCFSFILYQSA